MLFYFTATGNSLFIARQLDESPISIPQILKQDNLVFEDETIGIVAPVYAGELPPIVRRFLAKATLKANYMYMVLTYGMNDSVAGEWSYYYCKSQKINMDYIHTIKMVDNYTPSFDVDEQKKMDKQVDAQLEVIKKELNERKSYIPHPTEDGREKYDFVTRKPLNVNNGEQITVTDKCIDCGICTRVCPLGRFEIIDKKAVRKQNTCEFCLACLHSCPQKAIITCLSDISPNARYRHEDITLQDIIKSNQQ